MTMESPEQIKIEKEIKSKAQEFLKTFNASLPESMELEYEGFYRRGFFLTKKRYAVIEDGKIIAKGLELVRRDWATIAKKTQEAVLQSILSEGNVDKSLDIIKESLKRVKSGELELDELVIHTQITRNLSSYKQIGPHVMAARILQEHGLDVRSGTIVRYIIKKGKGPISQRAIPYEYSEGVEYDANYYINNQILPAVSRIMESLGYNEERLVEYANNERQVSLDEFF